MKKVIKQYLQLEAHVLLMIKAEFFIQLIGASFFLILNIYLSKMSFSDPQIANFISYRFLAVILLAFPLGFYIKGKPLKPFFIIGALGVPIVAIILVYSIKYQWNYYLPILFVLWGFTFTLFQVSSLPYVMRHTAAENQSHAISLSYATHSFGTIFSGIIIFLSAQFMREIDEGNILFGISILGFSAVYYLLKMKLDLGPSIKDNLRLDSYDWALIFKSIFLFK